MATRIGGAYAARSVPASGVRSSSVSGSSMSGCSIQASSRQSSTRRPDQRQGGGNSRTRPRDRDRFLVPPAALPSFPRPAATDGHHGRMAALSAYEQQRLDTIAGNMHFLSALGLGRVRPRRPASHRPSTEPSSAPGKLCVARGRVRRYQLKLQRRRARPRDHYLV